MTTNLHRHISAALAILFLFTLLVSCTPSSGESTAGTESGESQTQSGTGTESEDESRTPPTPPTYKTLVSNGKTYKPSSEPYAGTYPDTYGTELTDGVFAASDPASYTDESFVGYADSALSIVLDMADGGNKLYCFEVSYLALSTAGITAPSQIVVSVSDDGKEWNRVGVCVKPTYVEGTTQRAVLTLEAPVDAKYVRFVISRGATWIFLDEISVYADIEGSTNIGTDIDALYKADTFTDAQQTANLAAVSSSAPDRSLVKTLISRGMKYTLSRPASAKQHKDEGGAMLTDGATLGSRYESGCWVGFEGSEELSVTIAFSEVVSDIASIELYTYNRTATGICFPACVDISVSQDGTEYMRIARLYTATDATMTNYTFAFTPDKCVKAKYVRFTIPASERKWLLIEEAAVYAYRVSASEQMMYPDLSFPNVTKDEFWSSSTAGYSDSVNLIAGKSQQILAGTGLTYNEAHELNTPVTSKMITDGVKSSAAAPSNGTWFKMWSGLSRDIFFDLEKLSTVTGFSAGFLRFSSWGISVPGTVTLYLSDDGTNWYSVHTAQITPTSEAEVCRVEITLNKPVVARFARFSFSFSPHAYMDELELFGTKRVKSGTDRLSETGIKPSSLFGDDGSLGKYAAPDKDILGGAEDMLLAYHTSDKILDKDYFLSYAAYLDKSMNIADTMFDAFLFLPNTGDLPSGGKPYGESVKSDWDYIFDDLFKDGRNFDALDDAVGQIKTALGLSDYKVKVFATLLHPSAAITKFGDVDGDGVSENLSKVEDIQKVVEWYVERVEKEFAAKGYTNLELCGFYWFHEAINADSDDVVAIQNASAYLESKSSQLFWIPYYIASGYSRWAEYGFSAAYMQPNLAFDAEVPLSRIEDAVKIIKRYNMAIEIEVSSAAFSNDIFYEKYMEYLKGGVTYGYMDGAAHAYYQDVTFFYTACHSGDPRIRLMYDLTHDFIKGTLRIHPDKPEAISAETTAETAVDGVLGEVSVIREYRVNTSPAHGTVAVNDDGTFTYYPNKGFTGTDTFTFSVSEGLDWSESASVTVTVK